MDGSLERECSALGGLFQSVVNDLKNGYAVWDDFAQKTTKMHFQLKAAVAAVNVFLDSLQRVADLATNAKGATRDIGTALTRICMRHRSIENRLKTLTSALIDCLVLPLQEKLDDWRRTVATMDKEHSREYKRARSEIKKRSLDSGRLQKKVRKGQNNMQRMLDSAVQEVNDRYFLLLETERQAVRQALTEQRSQFCIFVSWFKPVMDGELSLLNEIAQLQEVVDLLYKHSADPYTLPPASEAVITDVKGLETTWRFQTPPSSPGSSLGSRKSSFCSLASAENSCQPSSHTSHTPLQPPMLGRLQSVQMSPRFSSISSQDSGFTSQDAIYHMLHPHSPKPIQTNQHRTASDEDGSHTESESQQSTPSPSPSSATWPEGTPGAAAIERIAQIVPPLQRPHTISATSTAQALKRPPLKPMTFIPPRPSSLFKDSPKTKRSSSQDPSAQRPPLPQSFGYLPPSTRPFRPASSMQSPAVVSGNASAAATPIIPDFNFVHPNQVIPQPIYANVQEFKPANGSTTATMENSSQDTMNDGQQKAAVMPGTLKQRLRRPLSFAGSDEATSFLNMALDGTHAVIRDDDEDTLIDECMDQIDSLSLELDRYCNTRSTKVTSSNNDISRPAMPTVFESASVSSYCTLPRNRNGHESGVSQFSRIHPPKLMSLRSLISGGSTTPVAPASIMINVATSNRRQSSSGRAPLPPMRRNSSITAATPTAPAVDIVRSRCTSPDDGTYASVTQLMADRHSVATPMSHDGLAPDQDQRYHGPPATSTSHYRQFQGSFRARSEPPIQEHAVYYSQQFRFAPPPVTESNSTANVSTRESLLMEIRNGVRLRPTAGGGRSQRDSVR